MNSILILNHFFSEMETRLKKKLRLAEDEAESVIPDDYKIFWRKFLDSQEKKGKATSSETASQTTQGIESCIKIDLDGEIVESPSRKVVLKLLKSKRKVEKMDLTVRSKKDTRLEFSLLEIFSSSLIDLKIEARTKSCDESASPFMSKNIYFPALQSLEINGWMIKKEIKAPNLTSLVISDMSSFHFEFFLPQFASSLTSLKLYYTFAWHVKTAINCLPNLKTLKCHIVIGEFDGLVIKPNSSIVELDIISQSQAVLFMEGLVNLEKFKIFPLSLNEAEWIFKNMMKLKKLQTLDSTITDQLYRELKDSNAEINRDIEVMSYFDTSM
jgi:hypothetical protein